MTKKGDIAHSSKVKKAGVITDSQLVSAALAGEELAFDHLYTRHRSRIMSICLRYCDGNRALANDTCQETFIRAFDRLTQLRDPDRFTIWLNEIARNVSITSMKKELTLDNVLREYEVVGKIMAEKKWTDAELQVVEDLIKGVNNPLVRQTIELFYLEGKSVNDIAVEQGISVTVITTRLNRFRSTYRKRIMKEIIKLEDRAIKSKK